MRIGELSRRTGVSERLLRYYEEQGLLRPARSASGYREYTEADTEAVRKIRILLSAGLGTALIAQILPCMHDDGNGLLAPTCAEMLTALEEAQDRLRASIAELAASDDVLTAVMSGAPEAEPGPGAPTAPARQADAGTDADADADADAEAQTEAGAQKGAGAGAGAEAA